MGDSPGREIPQTTHRSNMTHRQQSLLFHALYSFLMIVSAVMPRCLVCWLSIPLDTAQMLVQDRSWLLVLSRIEHSSCYY